MLARKKAKSLGNTSLNSQQDQCQSSLNREFSTPISILKKGTPSFSSSALIGGGTKRDRDRDEKDTRTTTSRRGPSLGITQKERPPLPLGNSGILGEIIPRMKNNLFSPEMSNVQKSRELRRLLNCLGDWGSIDDMTMLKLIQSLKENVEMLDEKMTTLVHQVLDSNWPSRTQKVTTAFEEFISELILLKPVFVGPVIQSLIRKFLPQAPCGNAKDPDEITITDQKIFEIAHRNLNRVLEAFPRMKESCIKTMGNIYPFMGKTPYIHYCYVKNLLESISYAPQLTCQVLQLCVHKLARIDVNVPRQNVESLDERIKSNTDEISQVKTEGRKTKAKLDPDQLINSLIFNSQIEIDPLVNILDLSLNLVFHSLETILENTEEVDLETFYDSMLSTFDSEILPSFGVNHVQFIYFYLMSKPSFTQRFLDFLWKKVVNVNTPGVLRIQCCAYIAGALARSTSVSVKILKRWLSRMAEFANNYVDQRVKTTHWSSVNLQMHGPFYAVCQAIFYVFAFRNKDLIGSRRCTAFTTTLNLGRLVTCNLNPLKACIEPVAEAFVSAAHTHQISYCQTVLERNQKATIPTSSRDSLTLSAMESLGSVTETLETFFPFDPFLIPRSRKWVGERYRTYEAYLPEVKIEKEEKSELNSNEDSIDMELSTSFKDSSGSHFMMARLMDSSDPTRFDVDMDE